MTPYTSWLLRFLPLSRACLLSACFVTTVAGADLAGSGYIDVTAPSGSSAANYVPPSSVTSPRLLWYPGKHALRFGTSSAAWNSGTIGVGSFGGGSNASASGAGSFAFGSATSSGAWSFSFHSAVSGQDAISIGRGSQVTGSRTVSIGAETESLYSGDAVVVGFDAASSYGNYGIAIGPSAIGQGDSVAIGQGVGSYMSGVAVGAGAVSPGGNAVAVGSGAASPGGGSLAVGTGASSVGPYSVALGLEIDVLSLGGVALGQYNNYLRRNGPLPSPSSPSSDDPVFSLGNGSSDTSRSNAFVIYRDGQASASKVRVYPSGNLSMGKFSAATDPGL